MFTKPFLFVFLFLFSLTYAQKDFYELRTYSVEFNASESELHNYLSEALLPAFNRQGIKNIGVLEELGNPTPKKIYLLIPYQSMVEYEVVLQKLSADEDFKKKRNPMMQFHIPDQLLVDTLPHYTLHLIAYPV